MGENHPSLGRLGIHLPHGMELLLKYCSIATDALRQCYSMNNESGVTSPMASATQLSKCVTTAFPIALRRYARFTHTHRMSTIATLRLSVTLPNVVGIQSQ